MDNPGPEKLLSKVNELVQTGQATVKMWENITSQASLNYIKPGMLCIDVGAHLGWYTALCARLAGPTGHVIAFEPIPDKADTCRNLALLMQDDKRFAPTEIHQVALGDKQEYKHVERGEAWSLKDLVLKDKHDTSFTAFFSTLDELFRGKTPKNVFLKLDVDGYETPVIFGGSRFISECKPTILLECGPYYARAMGYDFRKPLDFLEKIGYSFIADHGKPLEIREIMEYVPDSSTWNVFCVPNG